MVWLSSDSGFKWFGCRLIWDASDLVDKWFEIPMTLVLNWFGIQLIWMSNDLRFKWFGCQMIWDSNDLVVIWFGCQIWDSSDLVVIWFEMSKKKLWRSKNIKNEAFCETSFKIEALKLKNKAFLLDFLQEWSFEDQKRSFSARLPSKTKLWIWKINFCAKLHSKKELWRLKTELFCETSFKIETLMFKNEAFLRHFLQKWSFEAQKRSFCARLPSNMKLWRSKTKLLCETSFKNATLKLKNEAFVRHFLPKWTFEPQKRSFCARLPSKMKLWRLKTKLLCETSFKNEALKLKNEAFVRDFLPKWSFEHQKRSISARLPSKMTCWPHAWPQNYNTF